MVTAKKSSQINFLSAAKAISGFRPANIAALALITMLSLVFMAIPTMTYYNKSIQVQQDRTALTDSRYNEVKQLLQQQAKQSAALASLEGDRKILPFGKSKTQEAAAQLWDQVSPKVLSVDTYTIDNVAGSIALSFHVTHYADFLTVKETIETNGYFTLAAPFTVTKSDKAYACSVTLKTVNFEAWASAGKGGAAK